MKDLYLMFNALLKGAIIGALIVVVFLIVFFLLIHYHSIVIETIWPIIRFIFYLSIFVWFFIMFFKLLDRIANKDHPK